MRLRLLIAALLIAGTLAAWSWYKNPGAGPVLPLFDFVEYWAAGRLAVQGKNPYDPESIHELERQAGRTAAGVLMWNPPWTLPLVMPFGLLPVRTAHLLWLLLSFAALVYSADALWRFYGGDPGRRLVAWLIAFSFVPSLAALTAGQITPFVLLGAVLFLQAERRGAQSADQGERGALHAPRWFALAGGAAVLLAIKPHLVILFWLAVLLVSVRQRRMTLLLGGLFVGICATAVPLLCNPSVLGQYVNTLTAGGVAGAAEAESGAALARYDSPTLGTVLRKLIDRDGFWLQFVPVLPGVLWFLIWWRRRRLDWEWGKDLPLLLLVSMLLAPYGAWLFDLVVLLVPLLQVAARLQHAPRRLLAAGAFLLAVNVLAAVLLAVATAYLWFIWMTPALLAGYLVSRQESGVRKGGRLLTSDP